MKTKHKEYIRASKKNDVIIMCISGGIFALMVSNWGIISISLNIKFGLEILFCGITLLSIAAVLKGRD